MFLLLIGTAPSFVQSFFTGTNLKRITYKAWRDKYQALQLWFKHRKKKKKILLLIQQYNVISFIECATK